MAKKIEKKIRVVIDNKVVAVSKREFDQMVAQNNAKNEAEDLLNDKELMEEAKRLKAEKAKEAKAAKDKEIAEAKAAVNKNKGQTP